jgi:hypothetical protein
LLIFAEERPHFVVPRATARRLHRVVLLVDIDCVGISKSELDFAFPVFESARMLVVVEEG